MGLFHVTYAARGAPGAAVGASRWQAAVGTFISQPSRCLSAILFLRPVRAKYFPSPVYLFVKCLIWGKRRFFFLPDMLRGSGGGNTRAALDELPLQEAGLLKSLKPLMQSFDLCGLKLWPQSGHSASS